MKNILITAFEPFGGMEINSSLMVLNKLRVKCRDTVITKITLPVLYATAFEKLKDKITGLKPDAVICMGQAGGRDKISIERIAVNINNSEVPDNNGVLKTDEVIIAGGAAAYFTNLPYNKMLEAAGESAKVSHSAGTYICNDVYYRLMAYLKMENLHIPGGFLHLPFTEHFGKIPYIDLDKQVGTVESMLAVMGD